MAIKKYTVKASAEAKAVVASKGNYISAAQFADTLKSAKKKFNEKFKKGPYACAEYQGMGYIYYNDGSRIFVPSVCKTYDEALAKVKQLNAKDSGKVAASKSFKKTVKASSSLKVKPYVINKGQSGEYYGLKNAEDNQVLHSAPNNWKSEKGAINWAKKKGYEVVDSVCGKKSVKAAATLVRENDMEIVLRDDDGAELRVVKHPTVSGYRLRRTLNSGDGSKFQWDLSKEIYDTAEEAKQAALEGKATFHFKGRETIPSKPVQSSTNSKTTKKFGVKASANYSMWKETPYSVFIDGKKQMMSKYTTDRFGDKPMMVLPYYNKNTDTLVYKLGVLGKDNEFILIEDQFTSSGEAMEYGETYYNDETADRVWELQHGVESSKSVKKFGIKASKAAKKRVANKKKITAGQLYDHELYIAYTEHGPFAEGDTLDMCIKNMFGYGGVEDPQDILEYPIWVEQYDEPNDTATRRYTPEELYGIAVDDIQRNVTGAKKHKSIKCSSSDNYNDLDETMRFRVCSYYDTKFRDLAECKVFDDFDKAVDYAHECLGNGPTTIEDYYVGTVEIDPDEYWENFDGEFWCTPELADFRDEVWESMGIGASTDITAALDKKSDVNDEEYNQALAEEVADRLIAEGYSDITFTVAPEAISFFINDEVMFVQPTDMITPNMADIYDDSTELTNAVMEVLSDKMWQQYDEENQAMRSAWEDPDIDDPDYATRAVELSRDINCAEETVDIDDLEYITGDEDDEPAEDWGYGFDSNGDPIDESTVEELERIAQEILDKSEIHNIDEYADLHNFNYYASIPYIQESFDITFTYVADIYELSKNGMTTDEGIYTTAAPYNVRFNVRCKNGEVEYAECTDIDVNDGYVKDVELKNFNLDALVQFATDLVNPVAMDIYNGTTNI